MIRSACISTGKTAQTLQKPTFGDTETRWKSPSKLSMTGTTRVVGLHVLASKQAGGEGHLFSYSKL